MESSNAMYERKIRKLFVHITRLTDEDIENIRCQIKQGEIKTNEGPKAAKKKKTSSNYILESTGNDTSVQNCCQKPTKTKSKKKSSSSSSRRNCSRKSSSNKVILRDLKSYSAREESESEDVFVPKNIPMSPTLSKSDTVTESLTPAIPQETDHNNMISKFPIRRPVVLLKRMIFDEDTKFDICYVTVPNTNELLAKNFSHTNCCPQRQEMFQSSSTQAVTILSKSENSADEEFSQLLQTAHESCVADDEAPVLTNELAPCNLASQSESVVIPEITSNLKTAGFSPQFSCITSAVQTNNPEASTLSTPLTDAVAEASTQNTVSLKDGSVAARNQSDDAILSPVIFDEELEATREFNREVSSPIIFGTNEGTATECVDAPNGSNNNDQDAIFDISNSSLNFFLELSANTQSQKEAPNKSCNLTPDASQNFNLQLSENIPFQSIQNRNNSQESISNCSFALEIPGKCMIDEFSTCKDSQHFSSNDSTQSSKTNPSSSSETKALSSLSGLGAASISESENNGQFLSELNVFENHKIHLSAPNDESHLESDRIWSSAAKPSFLSENRNVLKSLYPTRQKITCLKKVPNLSGGEKNDSSMVEDSSLSTNQRSQCFTAEASHPLKSRKSNLSEVDASKTKESYSSFVEIPSYSVSEKSCMSVSDAANICRKSYSLPLERLNPLGTKKDNSTPTKETKMSASAPINCNDAYTQTDLQEVHQQPSQLNVNYIINSSSLDTIRFEGPVVNHPSTMTAMSEKIAASDSTCGAAKLHFHKVFSPNQTKKIPRTCNEGNISNLPESDDQLKKSSSTHAHTTAELTACQRDSTLDGGETAKQHCTNDEDSQLLASKIVIDSIDLTGDDELECGKQSSRSNIWLKTPSELGCTVAFTDDVERLLRHELPKLPCNLAKLDLLKKKQFHIFKLVLAEYYHGKPVNDTLQKLCSTRSVPCGSNLLRHFPPVGRSLSQISVKSPALQNSMGQKLFHGNSSGIDNRTQDSMLVRGRPGNATVLGRSIC